MVDKGEAHHVLGMSIKRDRKAKTLFISQPKYVENVLQRFGMKDCKPVSTPMEPGKSFKNYQMMKSHLIPRRINKQWDA